MRIKRDYYSRILEKHHQDRVRIGYYDRKTTIFPSMGIIAIVITVALVCAIAYR